MLTFAIRFALAVIPSYEAPDERTLNPEDGAPYTWTWLSTINRVNAQVMKASAACHPIFQIH